jgi:hypothetical protein
MRPFHEEDAMNVAELLTRDAADLVEEATDSVLRRHLGHYAAQGRDEVRGHVAALYDRLVACVASKDATAMIEHARAVAEARFASGFDLQEVQTAINVIEEAVWKRILAKLPPEELANAIGLVSTVLGMGKDALARSYVSLATRSHAPSLDLKALFRGTVGV